MPITCQRIGLPPISTNAFGTVSVRSRKRVPRPPQRITTGGLATSHGRKNRYLVALADGGVEALLEADVLTADVDVDEAAQVAVLGDPLAQVAVRVEDRVEHLAHGRAGNLHLGVSAGRGAQLGRDLHGDCHQATTSWCLSNSDSKLSRSGSISCIRKLSRVASSVFRPSPVM